MNDEYKVDRAVEISRAADVDAIAELGDPPAGIYRNPEDFWQEFGDITYIDGEVEKELIAQIHDDFAMALFYLQRFEHGGKPNAITATNMAHVLMRIGRVLVEAAYRNEYRSEHFQ